MQQEEFDTPTFREGQEIPFTLAKREYNVLGLLDYTQGNMWNVIYAATNPKGKDIGRMLTNLASKMLTPHEILHMRPVSLISGGSREEGTHYGCTF